jgi:hypothetical protein
VKLPQTGHRPRPGAYFQAVSADARLARATHLALAAFFVGSRSRLAAPKAEGVTGRVRVIAALLIVALAAGPTATHLYWMLGGTWGLGGIDASAGIRVVAWFSC